MHRIPTIVLGALAIVLAAFITWVAIDLTTTPTVPVHATTLVPCDDRAQIITVWRDDPTPCDVHGTQRLDVVGITYDQCADLGGNWIGDGIDICSDVDR